MTDKAPEQRREVVLGYRAWRVVSTPKGLRLASMNGVIWPPRQALVAKCRVRQRGHEVPHSACTCGIYSGRSRDHLVSMGYSRFRGDVGVVIGIVKLFGKVIVADVGYRAAKGYPGDLVVPHIIWQVARPLRETYLVETVIGDTFELPLEEDQDGDW